MTGLSQVRLALVAPSGAGKSTTARLLQQYFETADISVEVVKLAEPLYELQRAFYQQSCLAISEGAQNQQLLECIAQQLRALDSRSMVMNFAKRLACCEADVVINDDLRDDATDWPYLHDQGFQVIKIFTDASLRQSRLGKRGDVNVVADSVLDLQMRRIAADYALPNNHSLQRLEAHVAVIAKWSMRASRHWLGS